ncbi:hypothetical protein ACSNOK_22070 [Streptomyces sp. URMC 126]|uniref:hypothetical protein n=1 Tax=Streptomyces sp. URMC 126 TaxID=3423401 RepID=UPI003F1C9C27
MNALVFRGRDRYRPSQSHLVLLLLLMVVELVLAYYRLGRVGFFWMLGATAVLLAVGFFATLRCRTEVGAAGVTICWGFGRGRTHSWHEIRWVDLQESGNGADKSLAVRITLGNGRRRTLPGLHHSGFYPAPDIDVVFRQVIDWWKVSTRPEDRFRPPERRRDRLPPTMTGALLGLVITVVVTAVVFLRR